MIRIILRSIGVWPYLKHFRRKFFPSADQQKENEGIQERMSFYGQFIANQDLCFDIGANIGNRTEIFLKLGARVVAVEPQQECATMLKLRFGNKVTVIQKALGESIGNGLIYISETAELSSLSKHWIESVSKSRFNNKRWNRKQHVPITTLDEIIKLNGVPKFCKIDVEGFEAEVLKGLSSPIPIISFEYTIPEILTSVTNCIDKLSTLGEFKCNYTIGEEMHLKCKDWISKDELVTKINELSATTLFGDIYIRFS